MKRILSISKRGASIALFGAGMAIGSPAVAQVVNATCYMKTSSGQIIDLGVAMCGDTPHQTSGSGSETAFLAEFQREAARRASPDIRSLMGFGDANEARLVVDHAKSYCEGRKLGATDAEMRRSGRSALGSSRAGRASRLTIEISNDLAARHFCSEFAR